MNLYVWPNHLNAKSFDPECLTIITYIRIGQAPVNIYSEKRPWKFYETNFPYLEHSRNKKSGMKQIIPYFRAENYGIEYDLSDMDMLKLRGLTVNIENDLVPAILYFMWMNNDHLYNTKSIVGNIIGLPWSLFWPWFLYRQNREKVLSSRYEFLKFPQIQLLHNTAIVDDKILKTTLYTAAKRCLTSLDDILAKNDTKYFIGDRPTYVEALLYGFLWPVLNFEYEKDDALLSHINSCSKVLNLLNVIHDIYYPDCKIIEKRNVEDDEYGDKNLYKASKRFIRKHGRVIRDTTIFMSIALSIILFHGVRSRKM